MRDARPLIALAAVVALIGAVLFVLGAAQQPRKGAILTDRLGPESGESVPDYLVRATASLDGQSADPRYALVSLQRSITATDAARFAERIRVSEVLYRESTDRPPVTAGVSADPESVARSGGVVSDGCACAIALVVRGSTDQLRSVAAQPGVMAVEALPSDAVFGRFAVAPLGP